MCPHLYLPLFLCALVSMCPYLHVPTFLCVPPHLYPTPNLFMFQRYSILSLCAPISMCPHLCVPPISICLRLYVFLNIFICPHIYLYWLMVSKGVHIYVPQSVCAPISLSSRLYVPPSSICFHLYVSLDIFICSQTYSCWLMV